MLPLSLTKNHLIMKNSFLLLVLICCSLLITSCGGGELKDVSGKVVDIEAVSDSLISAKLTCNGDTMLFNFDDARFINGMFVSGDSVKISFIDGRNDTLRALVVNIIPHAPHYFNPDEAKNDTLVTAPANNKVSEVADSVAGN